MILAHQCKDLVLAHQPIILPIAASVTIGQFLRQLENLISRWDTHVSVLRSRVNAEIASQRVEGDVEPWLRRTLVMWSARAVGRGGPAYMWAQRKHGKGH